MKEFIASFHWVDYVLIFGLIRGGFVGYRDGALTELFRDVCYLITLVIVLTYSQSLAAVIHETTELNSDTATLLSYVLIGLLIYAALKLIVVILLRVIGPDKNLIMNATGLVLGAIRWAFIVSFIFLFFQKIAVIPTEDKNFYDSSRFGQNIGPLAPTLIEFIQGQIPPQDIPGVKATVIKKDTETEEAPATEEATTE